MKQALSHRHEDANDRRYTPRCFWSTRMFRGFACLAIAALLLPTLGIASDYLRALEALERGDSAAARELFMISAHRGHAASQAALGILFSTAEQSETRAEALGWLLAAQENGASNLQPHLAKAQAAGQSAEDPIVRSILRSYGRDAIARDWLPSYRDPNYDPCRTSVQETDPNEPKGVPDGSWQNAAIVVIERSSGGNLVDFHSVFRLPNGTDAVAEEMYVEEMSRRERTHPTSPNECNSVETLIVRSTRPKSNKQAILEDAVKLGERGIPEGQYVLGLALHLSNQPGGFDLVKVAAQGGHADAQYYVSKYLPNRVLARKWLELAADGGVAAAQIDLATEILASNDRASHLQRVESLVSSASSSSDDYVPTRVAAIRAAAPDAELRNLEAATNAARGVNIRKWPLPIRHEATALSFAASGDFTKAVRSQKAAIRLSQSMGHDTSKMEARLHAFEANQMWFGYLAAEYR